LLDAQRLLAEAAVRIVQDRSYRHDGLGARAGFVAWFAGLGSRSLISGALDVQAIRLDQRV
jgi:hypothetical protein